MNISDMNHEQLNQMQQQSSAVAQAATPVPVIIEFQSEFKGNMKTANDTQVAIGMEQVRPYDMVYGALVACFHSTYLEIMTKKRQTIKNASYEISGVKRQTVPTTLEYVTIKITIGGVSDELQSNKSFELAKKYCSVFQTISHVAEIEVMVVYI